MKKETNLESRIEGLLNSFTEYNLKEQAKTYLSEKTEEFDEKSKDFNTFYFNHIYIREEFLNGMILCEVIGNKEAKSATDVQFIYLNSQFIERHFAKIFADIEGAACSVDKARHIIRKLIKHFIDGEEIKIDLEDPKSYWVSKDFLNTHKDIIDMYKAIVSCQLGNISPLINQRAKAAKTALESVKKKGGS